MVVFAGRFFVGLLFAVVVVYVRFLFVLRVGICAA